MSVRCAGPSFGHPRRPHEEYGNLDRKSAADLGGTLVPHRVPGDVDRAFRMSLQSQNEPNHRPAIPSGRTMPRRGAGDPHDLAVPGLQIDALPGCEPHGSSPESPGTRLGGQNHPRAIDEKTPRAIEVVVMMVVAQHTVLRVLQSIRGWNGRRRQNSFGESPPGSGSDSIWRRSGFALR